MNASSPYRMGPTALGPEAVATVLVAMLAAGLGVWMLVGGMRTDAAPTSTAPAGTSLATAMPSHAAGGVQTAPPSGLVVRESALRSALAVDGELRALRDELQLAIGGGQGEPIRLATLIRRVNAKVTASIDSVATLTGDPAVVRVGQDLTASWQAILQAGRSTLGAGLANRNAYNHGARNVIAAIDALGPIDVRLNEALAAGAP
jgi:hypothetical protein